MDDDLEARYRQLMELVKRGVLDKNDRPIGRIESEIDQRRTLAVLRTLVFGTLSLAYGMPPGPYADRAALRLSLSRRSPPARPDRLL